jgi:cholesterol transport system auxiliary component
MRRLTTILTTLALGVSLSACGILSGGKPVNLYRFSVQPVSTAPASTGQRFGVLLSPTDFVEAASSDRILTATGGQLAYIKDVRWASAADVLFDEAVARKFQGAPGRARLLQRGEVAKADYVLKLDVRTFETRYAYAEAVPEVVVEVRALLSSNQDRSVLGERVFTSTVRAADNRVGAIVPAYDEAVDSVLTELYSWVNSSPR